MFTIYTFFILHIIPSHGVMSIKVLFMFGQNAKSSDYLAVFVIKMEDYLRLAVPRGTAPGGGGFPGGK